MRAVGALKVFLIGAVAVGVVGYALAVAFAVTAQAGGRPLEIGIGPVVVVSVAEAQRGSARVTTFGPGLVALALAGGLANLASAQLLRHRSRRSGDRVE